MSAPQVELVAGFELAADRYLEPTSHVWVQVLAPDRVRLGMDALGAETSGTLAALVLLPEGTVLSAGQAYGSVEAAKFIGPLTTPVAGTVLATNGAVCADAGLVERDPYGDGWLIDLEPADLARDLARLVTGEEARARFAARVAEYRSAGVLAQ
ncbi:MAG: glycine cleavage system protein H [Mycobacteriales bacterium]